jgi:hypothetical protein
MNQISHFSCGLQIEFLEFLFSDWNCQVGSDAISDFVLASSLELFNLQQGDGP